MKEDHDRASYYWVEEDQKDRPMKWPRHFWDPDSAHNPSYDRSAYRHYLKTLYIKGGWSKFID